MRGRLFVINPDPTQSIDRDIFGEPLLADLQRYVGGYIELVPYFNTIRSNGKIERCVAFCNERGKLEGKPFNYRASQLWEEAMRRANGISIAPDYLVGTVIVIAGDAELMESMREA